MRRSISGAFLLVALASAGGCKSKAATGIIVSISSEAPTPAELDSLEVLVNRKGENTFELPYLLDRDARLPGTLTLTKAEDAEATDPITVTIRAKRDGDPTWRVLRRATLSFSEGKTKLLRMPLRYSCHDFPCDDGYSCLGGVCKVQAVDVERLPDFVDNQTELSPTPPPTASMSGAAVSCFDPTVCLKNATPLGLGGGNCTFTVNPDGKFNVGMTWSKGPGMVVVEQDAEEGFTWASHEAKLSEGLCAALDDGRATGVFLSTACNVKPVGLPVCVLNGATVDPPGTGGAAGMAGAPPAGSGGSGGTAGSSVGGASGTGGASGAGGSSGAGGTGGASGMGGASGTAGVSGSAGAGGCGASTLPTLEVCNGVDDDGNGCAEDGSPCINQYPTAGGVTWNSCLGSTCTIGKCPGGTSDANGYAHDGCEQGASVPTFVPTAETLVIFARSAANDRLITLQPATSAVDVQTALLRWSSAEVGLAIDEMSLTAGKPVLWGVPQGQSAIQGWGALNPLGPDQFPIGPSLLQLDLGQPAPVAVPSSVTVSGEAGVILATYLVGGPATYDLAVYDGPSPVWFELTPSLSGGLPVEPSVRPGVAVIPAPFASKVVAFSGTDGKLQAKYFDGMLGQFVDAALPAVSVVAGSRILVVPDGSSALPHVLYKNPSGFLCRVSAMGALDGAWLDGGCLSATAIQGDATAMYFGYSLMNLVAWWDAAGKLQVLSGPIELGSSPKALTVSAVAPAPLLALPGIDGTAAGYLVVGGTSIHVERILDLTGSSASAGDFPYPASALSGVTLPKP